MDEVLKKYLIQEGYRFLDAGGKKENLMIHLLQCRDNYQNSGGIRNQRTNMLLEF